MRRTVVPALALSTNSSINMSSFRSIRIWVNVMSNMESNVRITAANSHSRNTNDFKRDTGSEGMGEVINEKRFIHKQ